MNTGTDRSNRPIWVGLGLTVALLGLALVVSRLGAQRPTGPALPVLGQVADFTLTNQNGEAVSLADLRGQAWVADIIFTRCAGPCLRMTRQMKELQEALPAAGGPRLISLTTDPDFDQPPVLKTYAARFGADPAHWQFLTGTKAQIARVAIDSLKLTTVEKKPEERESPADLFIHSTIFVLVDAQGRLRGVFQTDDENVPWPEAKRQLLAAVAQLEKAP